AAVLLGAALRARDRAPGADGGERPTAASARDRPGRPRQRVLGTVLLRHPPCRGGAGDPRQPRGRSRLARGAGRAPRRHRGGHGAPRRHGGDLHLRRARRRIASTLPRHRRPSGCGGLARPHARRGLQRPGPGRVPGGHRGRLGLPLPRSAAGAGRGAVGHLLRSRKDLLMNDSSTAGSLRFGVIGVGIIGRQHVARLLSDASPATLVALADANPDAARAVAEENGVEAAASVEELLAREDIDVVIIAVPSGLHADVTVEALAAGKHVVLEQRSGKILSIASQRRFAAENQFLKSLVSEGKLGRLTSATIEVPLWRSQEYYDSGAWRGTWKLDGGGALMNQGVHLVDLALWLL